VVAELLVSMMVGLGTTLLGVDVGVGIVSSLVTFVIALQIQLLAEVAEPFITVTAIDEGSGEYLIALAEAQSRYLTSLARPATFDLELAQQRAALLERYEECARGMMRLELRPSSILRETDGVYAVSADLKATSVVNPIEYWDSPSGLSYLAQQEALLESGVRMTRVFIEDKTRLPDLVAVVSRHLEWKRRGLPIGVRIALIDRLDQDLVSDYAIVDNGMVIRLETQRGVPVAVVYETFPSSVERALRSFDRLWTMAIDASEFAEFSNRVE
jgi:hypothetical protein